jgi:hypothetical protein
VLSDGQVGEVARLALMVHRDYGRVPGCRVGVAGDRLWLVQARPITTLRAAEEPDVPLVAGLPAAPGRVAGRVRVLRSPAEGGAPQPGEVLVASMTNPDWLPTMRRAAAVVTCSGGATCTGVGRDLRPVRHRASWGARGGRARRPRASDFRRGRCRAAPPGPARHWRRAFGRAVTAPVAVARAPEVDVAAAARGQWPPLGRKWSRLRWQRRRRRRNRFVWRRDPTLVRGTTVEANGRTTCPYGNPFRPYRDRLRGGRGQSGWASSLPSAGAAGCDRRTDQARFTAVRVVGEPTVSS